MPHKYTYPDSEVLRNKFDLRDPIAAHTMETRLAYQRVAELVQNPVQGTFDLDHLLEINRGRCRTCTSEPATSGTSRPVRRTPD
jgi:fido (protein-threonine AMPylation protein)